jgi:phosphoesterase RecJ-like protein
MDPYKTNRLNAALQRSLSDLIATQVKDPRVGMVSISQVELNRDHSVARVFVAVTGDDEERKKSMAGLRKAAGFLQGQVGRGLRLRTVPELRFEYDDSLDRGFGVEEMLRELEDRGEFQDEQERKRRLTLADFEPPRELVEPLRAARTVWLTGHWNPDPDCMGAALALGEVLRRLDKDVTVLRFPDPAAGLTTLPGWEFTEEAATAEELLAADPPDLVVLVDCHRTDRTGPLRDTIDRCPAIVCIDHHLVSGRRAPVAGWLESRAESTCTLAYRLIEELAGDGADDLITTDVATNIFAGLAGDTGGFRFDNTTPLTFHLAADLAERGVDTAGVQHVLLHERRRQALDLLQRALVETAYHGGGRVAVMPITQAMLAETGALMEETEGFVNILTAVAGVRYAALVKELAEGGWRVSLRTNGGDVQAVAAAFGGGGHKVAAGCTLEGDAEEVMAAVTDALLGAE